MRKQKLRIYSILLTLFCSVLYINGFAQVSDTVQMPDVNDRNEKTLELNSGDKSLRISQNVDSDIIIADRGNTGTRNKKGVSSWIRSMNLESRIDNGVQALKDLNLDQKFNNLLEDLDSKGNLRTRDSYRDNEWQNNDRTKTISKSYTVDKDDKLRIKNSYGKIIINIWQKNEVKVDVEVKAYAATDSRAQQSLDEVHINESRQGSIISFETVYDRSNYRGQKGEKREVNYTVYMPSSNALELKNSYGNTSVMSDFSGPVSIQQSYGNFTARDLASGSNNINASYGTVTIENIKAASLDISYGNLKVMSAGRLNGSLSYSPVRIDRVSGDLDLNLNYTGDLKISKIDQTVKNININASYSSVSLMFDPNASFNFSVAGTHTSFDFDRSRVSSLSSMVNKENKMYNGKYGKDTDNRVNIRSHYGSVKFL